MMKYNFLILISFLSFCSCQSEMNYESNKASIPMAEVSNTSINTSNIESARNGNESVVNKTMPSIIGLDAKLVRKANLRLNVLDIEQSIEEINQLAIINGGVVSSLDLNQSTYHSTSSLELKVPSAQFNSLLNELKKEGERVVSLKVDIDDVTNSYRDMESRLRVKKQVRDQLVDLLRNKAKTFEEVYHAENQIKIIQEEIESVQSRFNYLEKQIAYSTIKVALVQKKELAKTELVKASFFNEMLSQIKGGWVFVKGGLLFAAGIWPFILLVTLGFLFKRRIRVFMLR